MKVILISGKAGHGKDTAARYMSEQMTMDGFSNIIIHYADLVKYVCQKFFHWDGNKDERGRHLLQYVGTDIVRKQNPNFWVEFVSDILTFFDGEWDYVLIPDCRFPNEIGKMVSKFNTKHVRVVRPEYTGVLTDEQKKHPSETALDDVTPDYVLYNTGSEDALKNIAVKLLKEELYDN